MIRQDRVSELMQGRDRGGEAHHSSRAVELWSRSGGQVRLLVVTVRLFVSSF